MYASRPSADFELSVKRPNGTQVALSTSHDNTYELVDFIPDTTGFHKIEVKKVRCEWSRARWAGPGTTTDPLPKADAVPIASVFVTRADAPSTREHGPRPDVGSGQGKSVPPPVTPSTSPTT